MRGQGWNPKLLQLYPVSCWIFLTGAGLVDELYNEQIINFLRRLFFRARKRQARKCMAGALR
jgi:hypothetical protein